MAAEARVFLTKQGVDLSGDQETKTKKALEFFAGTPRRQVMSMMRRRQAEDEQPVELDPRDLTGLFAAPRWLRDLGFSAWLAVGVTLFVVGVMGLLTLTHTIVAPVLAASVIAAVASPLVRWLDEHGLSRGVAAALMLVGIIVLAFAVAGMVFGGITSQKDGIRTQLSEAKDTLADWTTDVGVDEQAAEDAKEDVVRRAQRRRPGPARRRRAAGSRDSRRSSSSCL